MAACTRGTWPKAGRRPTRLALTSREELVFRAWEAGKVCCASAANLKGRATICAPPPPLSACLWVSAGMHCVGVGFAAAAPPAVPPASLDPCL